MVSMASGRMAKMTRAVKALILQVRVPSCASFFWCVCDIFWYFFEAPIVVKAVQMFFQLTWFDLNSLCKLVTALSNLSSVCALGSVLVSLQSFFRLKTGLR